MSDYVTFNFMPLQRSDVVWYLLLLARVDVVPAAF